MSRTFAILGKLLLGAILLIAILTAGYFIGTNKNAKNLSTFSTPNIDTKIETITSPTDIPKEELKSILTVEKKAVTGGMSENTSFKKYTMEVPKDWSEKREIMNGISEKLTLSKDGYALIIYQAPMDGSMCLYNESKPFEGPSQKYSEFVEIEGKDIVLRRSFNLSEGATQSQTICEEKADTFATPTQFGAISAVISLPENETITQELDAILRSLQKEKE